MAEHDTKLSQNVPRMSTSKTSGTQNHSIPEENPSIGPFAPNAANNAPVWAIYGAQAKISDQQIFKICNNDLDSLLIFAGLFSTILSAFLIEIRKGLQEDLQGTTNALLLSLIELQRNSSAALTARDTFVPTLGSRWMNGLWFSALIFSLTSALGASLAKGWVAQYDQASSGTTAEDACSRHRRYVGIGSWHLQSLILALPILIHIAFFQFFGGLIILLRQDDLIIGNVILGLVAITISLYLITTFLLTMWPDCPYQSPLSRPISNAIRSFLQFDAGNKVSAPTKASALAWLLQNSTNEEDVKMTVKALAGLPTTAEVERSLRERKVVDILTREASKYMDIMLHSYSIEDSNYLEACLHTIIRLLQSGPPSAGSALEPLQILMDPKDPSRLCSRWSELGRGSYEVALCIVARLQLFYPIATRDESLFTRVLPMIQKSCRQQNLKSMLVEVSVLCHPSKDRLLRDLQDEQLTVRARAVEDLKAASCLDAQVGFSIKSRRYREWRRRLDSQSEDEQVECIAEFEKLLDDEGFRKEIVLSGDKCLIQTMLATGRCAVNVSVLEMLEPLLTHGEVRHALIDSACINALFAPVTDPEWDLYGVVNAARHLANYNDTRAKILESTALAAIIGFLKDSDVSVRLTSLWLVSGLVKHGAAPVPSSRTEASSDDARAKVMESTALLETISLLKDKISSIRDAALSVVLSLADHDGARAKIIDSTAFPEIIALLKNEDSQLLDDAVELIEKLIAHEDFRAKMVESTALSETISLLKDENSDIRDAALSVVLSLAGHDSARAKIIDSAAISEIIASMKGGVASMRGVATDALSRLASHDDIRALIIKPSVLSGIVELIKDDSWRTRREAFRLLSSLVAYDDARAAIIQLTALSGIVQSLEDSELEVRQAALKVVLSFVDRDDARAKIIDSNLLSQILGSLKTSDKDVRKVALKVVLSLASYDDARAMIVESATPLALLKDENKEFRNISLQVFLSLTAFKDTRAKIVESPALLEAISLLKDENEEIRNAALELVLSLSGYDHARVKVVASTALSEIIVSMKVGNGSTRGAAIVAFSRLIGHDYIRALIFESILPEIIVLMKDKYWRVREATLDLISNLVGHDDARAAIMRSTALSEIFASLKDSDEDVRGATLKVVFSLAGYDDARAKVIESTALSESIALLNDDKWQIRKTVLNALSNLAAYGDTRAKIIESNALLETIALLKNESWQLRRAALDVLSRLSVYDEARAKIVESTALSEIIALLKDENRQLHEASLDVLSRFSAYDDTRAKLIELNALLDIIALLKSGKEQLQNAALKAILSLADHDDVQAKMVETNLLSEIVVSLKNINGCKAVVTILLKLAKADAARAKIIEPTTLSEIIALLKGERVAPPVAALEILSGLSAYDNARASIIESTALFEIIASLKIEAGLVQHAVLKALSSLAKYDDVKAKILESTLLSELIKLTKHNSRSVREVATEILPMFVDHSFDFRHITRLLDDHSPDVVVSVLSLISGLSHYEPMRTVLMEDHLTRLVELLKHEFMWHGCINLISALCDYPDMEEILRDSDVVTTLVPWLSSPDKRMESSAVETFSKLGLYDAT